MHTDFDRCYRAVQAKDARFDGWFVIAVLSTGIYCRPSCPVRPPLARNMRFYPTAAAAQRGGFRACKRCRPDASPGSPEWNVRGDVVARTMRLIADGVVDREGVAGLAARLGYTARQLERLTSRATLGVQRARVAGARAQVGLHRDPHLITHGSRRGVVEVDAIGGSAGVGHGRGSAAAPR